MKKQTITYFAAANTYRGFVSYFDRVFSSEKYDRIFVLKGGPGTGKSSLMRKISSTLSEKEFALEEILCSSDPYSLDGIIAEKNGKRFAIIDGTAPHERDAVIPGAIDEIINLGDNWDERWITSRKKDILELVNEKKKAYKTAYKYLRLAGECDSFASEVKLSGFDKSRAKYKAEQILSEYLVKEKGVINTILCSSFGRHGDYKIDIQKELYKDEITLSGDAFLFLRECKELLISAGVDITLFPSAKNPDDLEAVLINTPGLLIQSGTNGEINADDYIVLSDIGKERFRVAGELHKELLYEAKRWFNIAAELHFSLEDIYSGAMDFTRNDEITDRIYQKIINISEKGQ